MTAYARLRTFPGRLLVRALNVLPQKQLESLIVGLANRRASALPPAEALRMLFLIDAALYPLAGRYAVAYGDGLHTKHRHTGYHDFFVGACDKGERVLEVGCGNGALAHDVATKAGCRVTAVDVNADSIAAAKRAYVDDGVNWQVADAAQTLPDGQFDVVILSNVLEHFADRPHLLRRIGESTSAERILIRVPLFDRDWRVPLKKELGVEWRLDPTHETEYTLESFAAEIAQAGLRIAHQQVRWGEIWAEVRA